MNTHCYKTVFSKRLGTLVAVGEQTSSQGKANGSFAGLGGYRFTGTGPIPGACFVSALTLSFCLVTLAWAAPAPNALPTGGQVAQGTAAISQSAANMAIHQSTARAVVNWQSFDIGKDAKVNIVQPNAQAVLMNRVTGTAPSQIFGQLRANGQVVLVNPNGVTFGKDGSVSAAGLTASTLNTTDADFMSGRNRFTRDGATGQVLNQGTLTAAPGGYVALLGASVSNEGKIVAPQGNVALGAAESITLPVYGSRRIKMELTPSAINAAVANQRGGSIVTEGGQVYMQAAAVGSAMASVMQSGNMDTSGVQGGAVHLLADGGRIVVDGSITANSTAAGHPGGDIVIGRDLDSGALAQTTDVSGAKLQSQGGFVETSGKWLLTDGTRVHAKDWLLDPYNITITSGSPSGTAYTDPNSTGGSYAYTAAANTSIIRNTDIQNSLNDGTNVTITTGTGSGGQDGNITVAANIAKTTGTKATLTLEANNGIWFSSGVKITGTGTGQLDVVLKAQGRAANSANSFGVYMQGGAGIDTNGQVRIDATTRQTGFWDFTRSALAMSSGAMIRGTDLNFVLNVDLPVVNRVYGAFLQNATTLEATAGSIRMAATQKGVGSVNGNNAGSILLGSGTGNAVQIKASKNITLMGDATAASNIAGTGAIGLVDTKMQAGGHVLIEANVQASSNQAIEAGRDGSNHGFSAVSTGNGDVTFKANQGDIKLSELTQAITGNNITIDNTGGTSNDANGALLASVAGTGSANTLTGVALSARSGVNNAIQATGAVQLSGNSTKGSGLTVSAGITGASIALNGTSVDGFGVGGIGRLQATAGGVSVQGQSLNHVAANINNSITATGDIQLTGKSQNWHGLFTNGALTSTGGSITVWGETTKGAGLALGGGGSMSALKDITITGQADAFFGIGGFGALTSAQGNITLTGTSNQSLGVKLNNALTATRGTVSVSGITQGPAAGVNIENNTAIEAVSYKVYGSSLHNAGVNTSGTSSFKSTSTTVASVIEGKGTLGVQANSGTLSIDSGPGQAVLRSTTDSSGGVFLGSMTLNTQGDVTVGSKLNTNGNLRIRGTTLTAQGGRLSLLGKSSGEGISIQDNAPTPATITGLNGAQLVIDGESTGTGTGVNMRLNNISNTITANGAGGSISLQGVSSQGTGLNLDLAKITGNNGSAVTLTGQGSTSGRGAGKGVYIANAISANGGGNILITGSSAGTGSAVEINHNGGAAAITADSGNITITGEAKGAFGLGIYNAGVITGGSLVLEGSSNGDQGVFSNSQGKLSSTQAQVRITGRSALKAGTQIQSTLNAKQDIVLEGTSASTTNAQGLLVQNQITSIDGNITATGQTQAASQRAVAITQLSGSTFGSLETRGSNTSIQINANTLLIANGSAVKAGSTGTVHLQTTTAGNTIQIGAEDTFNTTLTRQVLGIDNSELNRITAANLVVGNASSTGTITVAGPTQTLATTGDVRLQTGGDIVLNKTLDVGTKKLSLQAAGTATQNAGAAIKAAELQLLGSTGNFFLNEKTNAVGKLAAQVQKLDFTNALALNLDAVSVQGTTTTGITTANGAAITTQTGNLSILQGINNTSTGDVVLGAGVAAAAGQDLGSNVLTTAGKTVSNGTRNTFIYTGNVSQTGTLSALDGTLSNLDFSAIAGGLQNADSSTAFETDGTRNVIAGGAQAQVMFREKVAIGALDGDISLNKTYGDSSTLNTASGLLMADVLSQLKNKNLGETTVTGRQAGTLRIANAVLLDSMSASLQGATYSTSNYLRASDTAYSFGEFNSSKYASTIAADTVKFVIGKKAASLSATLSNPTYSGNTIRQDPAISTGFLAGDDILVSGTAQGNNAGTYTSDLIATGGDVSNYTIAVTNASLKIAPSTSIVILTANSASTTYNGTTQSVSGFAVTGLVGDDATNSAAAVAGLSAGTSAKNAGSYASTFTGNNTQLANNYANLNFVAGSLNIDKANASVTSTDTTATADGTLQTQSTPTKSGFMAGEDVNVSGLATGTAAGTYNSNLSLSPANAATLLTNYNINITNAALTINPAAANANASVIPVTIPQARSVTPISRLTLSGFSNQSGIGAAVAGGVDAQESSSNNANPLSCTPESDIDCTCEEIGVTGVEMCLAPASNS
ncbi:filamentous hemagglutinin N-terminal domain-containing protein [Limnohabitans planktonicus]|nr:filamentous hemagglutinin N-terminal domain-containing protein [Limnohabitans planktonicus]|eukprot:gene23941-28986_t